MGESGDATCETAKCSYHKLQRGRCNFLHVQAKVNVTTHMATITNGEAMPQWTSGQGVQVYAQLAKARVTKEVVLHQLDDEVASG